MFGFGDALMRTVRNWIGLDELPQTQTEGYRPAPDRNYYRWHYEGLPPFTIEEAERMRTHPQIKLGLGIKVAPLLKPKFKIKASSPEVGEFVAETIRSVWTNAMPTIAENGLIYSRSGGEMVYRYDRRDSKWRFDRYHEVYPLDFTVLTKRGKLHALRVALRQGFSGGGSPVTIVGPKAFLYVHRRRFGSWHGESELRGSYSPWHEQVTEGGAKQTRKLWYWKCAFSSGEWRYPVGVSPHPETGENVDNLEIARQAAEYSRTGGSVILPNGVDGNGNQIWGWNPPVVHGTGADILEYGDRLDTEMLRGLGIPDDVVSQVSETGSFAGRTVPLSAFFSSQSTTVSDLACVTCEQVVDPLLRLNYGDDAWYEIVSAEVDVDALMPSTPSGNPPEGSPEDGDGGDGSGPGGGGDGTPQPPRPGGGNVAQFSRDGEREHCIVTIRRGDIDVRERRAASRKVVAQFSFNEHDILAMAGDGSGGKFREEDR